MSDEKPQSPTPSSNRIARPIALEPHLTPSQPAVAQAQDPPGSIPPPPPSRRPLSERPVPLGTSPLPPPISARPTLPTAPPVARVGKQHLSEADFKRLEEENQSLREKLAAAREETKVEHKNVERLRSEVAHLKAKAASLRPTSMTSRAEIDRLRADHLQEIRELKRKHQSELDDKSRSHRTELALLKREYQTELSQHEKKATLHEKSEPRITEHGLDELRKELEDLRQKTAVFRQKTTELREANGELERQLQEAELRAAAAPPAAISQSDDLTELKGVGPKVAQALRAIGVTRFDQIAAWTEADIDDVAPKIKTAAGRIRKSDWIAQAKRKVS